MDCKYFDEKVWLFVEGDLNPRQDRLLARHIGSCPRCAELVEEVRESQEWLRSFEPAEFDEFLMASVREGARNKIDELERTRSRSVRLFAVFAGFNWKPLVIACPSLVLVCWFVVRWGTGPSRNRPYSGPSPAASFGNREGGDKLAGRTPLVGGDGDDVKKVFGPHKRRIRKPVEQPTPASADDRSLLAAAGVTKTTAGATSMSAASPLRIEIQTEDPKVRIIWFAAPGDGSVQSGPD